MTRVSKQEERRNRVLFKRKFAGRAYQPEQTGPVRDNLKEGLVPHKNAAKSVSGVFIPQI